MALNFLDDNDEDDVGYVRVMFLRQAGTTLAIHHSHSGIPPCKLTGLTEVCRAPSMQYIRQTLCLILQSHVYRQFLLAKFDTTR